MGGTQLRFGTPTINRAQSLAFAAPWATGSYGGHTPQQQLLQSLQQLLQLDYVQQQQVLHLVSHRLQLLQQLQQLIQVVAQQQTFLPHGSFPGSSFPGPTGWLTGTQGIQPQIFSGQAGYVM